MLQAKSAAPVVERGQDINAQHNRLDHRLAVLVVLGAVLLSLAAAAPAAEPEASISATVVGNGRMQSSPAGLDCGVGTCAGAFPLGSAVQSGVGRVSR